MLKSPERRVRLWRIGVVKYRMRDRSCGPGLRIREISLMELPMDVACLHLAAIEQLPQFTLEGSHISECIRVSERELRRPAVPLEAVHLYWTPDPSKGSQRCNRICRRPQADVPDEKRSSGVCLRSFDKILRSNVQMLRFADGTQAGVKCLALSP